MSTFSQISSYKSKARVTKKRSKKLIALNNCPQKQGVCIKLVRRTPKKPNSAQRKLAYVRLSNNRRIYAYLPGEGKSALQEHSVVLVRAGRVKDLPGLNIKWFAVYMILPDTQIVKKARSKYGTKITKKLFKF
jgi:small subunit ribosomal protein S12